MTAGGATRGPDDGGGGGGDGGDGGDGGATLRLDLWLWYARFFKSRTMATRRCTLGKVRVNRRVVRKAHHPVRPGDVLTFAQAREIRVVRILELAGRRGPASEAQTLYEDLAPPEPRTTAKAAPFAGPLAAPVAARREPGAGRPTKAERRATDRLKRED